MLNRLALLILCSTLSIASMATEITLGDSTFVGGRVQVDEAVDGPLTAAAGRISVNAPVSGSARLAAGRIHINAAVTGDVQAAAGRVTIDAPIGGDVKVAAGALKLGPNARIAGSLHFRGARFERDPGAQVAGTIDHSTAHTREIAPFGGAAGRWIWTATLVLLAALAAAAMPGASTRMARELRERPGMAPLLGFIAITCIPVAAVLVMITIIGIPIGILALFAYAALLLVGYVCVSVVVGGLLLERVKVESAALWAWRAGAAALAMLLLALLTRIPFVGGLILFAALVFGVGLVVAAVFRKGEAPPVVAA
jgi:hypothetical protein